MPTPPTILQVALPVPVTRLFDYTLPADMAPPAPGCRVTVPFGNRRITGVVMALTDQSHLPVGRLKAIERVLDESPVLPADLLQLLVWASAYYHHAIGEVVAAALPRSLRAGKPAEIARQLRWQISDLGRELDLQELRRAPIQLKLLSCLRESPKPLTADRFAELSKNWRAAMGALLEKGLVAQTTESCTALPHVTAVPGPPPGREQHTAAEAINRQQGFQVFLLNGVTGSGKTEVYLAAINHQLERHRQVLMLIPEIGLTPQLVSRVQQRTEFPVLALHSGLTDNERHNVWLQAQSGTPLVLLGTRSAVFTPLPRMGLVVVDEEHDPSFKQQDGFRYHARNLAIMRARDKGVAIVLGSATPSLESMLNADNGNYRMLQITERAGGAQLPRVGLIDMRQQAVNDGLSPPMISAIGKRLDQGEQSLLFLNRRGYAPVIMCRDCGWTQHCPRCDAHMIVHHGQGRSRCHHCGSETRIPAQCPACASTHLKPVGEGTERVEQALIKLFPDARIVRVDRDSTSRKGSLQQTLEAIRDAKIDIIVGTQMLSKGHDFPMITLVGVLNADQGLYGADFRGPEHLIQQVMQVSGRAGRADRTGEVLIQTWHPDHAVFRALLCHDYARFAKLALAERQLAGFPPYSSFALLRAETPARGKALEFLVQAAATGAKLARNNPGVRVFDAVPAPMEKRAGRYRAQLLVSADQRGPLHRFLSLWLATVEQQPDSRKVRWSIDVDPMDMH